MTIPKTNPALRCIPGGILALSGSGLKELLQAVIEKKASFRFRAKGISMHPFIKDGDIVTISPLSNGDPHLGDVVAFCQPKTGRLVVHRIIKKTSSGYFIQGDNASESDCFKAIDEIVGRVIRVERQGRRILFGQGLEKRALAFLSRNRMLQPLVYRARALSRRASIRRRWNKSKPPL